jgi:hypothetical protein
MQNALIFVKGIHYSSENDEVSNFFGELANCVVDVFQIQQRT